MYREDTHINHQTVVYQLVAAQKLLSYNSPFDVEILLFGHDKRLKVGVRLGESNRSWGSYDFQRPHNGLVEKVGPQHDDENNAKHVAEVGVLPG